MILPESLSGRRPIHLDLFAALIGRPLEDRYALDIFGTLAALPEPQLLKEMDGARIVTVHVQP